MKTTLKKSLSVLLAVLMIFSSFSVVMYAAAEDEEKTEYNATFILDAVDKVLAEQNLNDKIDLGDYKDTLSGLGITIDLNSVNGLCKTLYSFAKIWNSDSITVTILLSGLKAAMGDLKSLDFTVWKTSHARGTEAKDLKILTDTVTFLKANTSLVHKFLKGNLSLGAIGNVVKIDGKTLTETVNGVLGDDGACGLLKGMLAGLVYEEGSDEYNACIAKSLDKLIFEDLVTVGIAKLLGMADESILTNYVNIDEPNELWSYIYKDCGFTFASALDGFTYDSSASLDGFIADIANAVYKKFQPTLNKLVAKYGETLNDLVFTAGKFATPFKDLCDFSKLNAVDFTAESITDINEFAGIIVGQLTSNKAPWDNSKNLGENFENLMMWVINNRDKTVEGDPYAAVTGSTFADYALSLAKAIVANVVTGDDAATVVKTMNSCTNATQVITKLVTYLVNREDTIVGSKSTTWEAVLGDIAGYYLKGLVGGLDSYKTASGTSIYDVLNAVANYYLVDMNLDALLGLSLTSSQTFLTKLDKIQAVLFKGTEYVKASKFIPALIEDILALDAKGLVADEFEAAFTDKNASTPAASLVCTVVNNVYTAVLDNALLSKTTTAATCTATGKDVWKCKLCGNKVCTAKLAKLPHTYTVYKTTKAAKPGTAGVQTAYCKVCGAKGTATKAIAAPKTITVKNASLAYTGKALTNTVTVKDTAGKTISSSYYTVSYANNKAVGTATVKVTFKTNYSGTLSTTFKIVPAQVKSVKKTANTKDSVTISWAKVTGAKYYKVEQSLNGKTWTVVSKAQTATTYTAKKLKANTAYQYRVTAMDSTKKLVGAASAVLKTGTTTTAATVTLKSTKSKTATATWKAVTGAKSYIVYKSTDGKKWTKVTTTKSSVKTATLTKLTAGKVIYVKVATVNAYGSIDSATAKVTVKK